MKQARSCDPLLTQLAGLDIETGVALPKDGTFARRLVEKNKRTLAFACGDFQQVSFDTLASELFAMHLAGMVVANLSDIAGTQTPSPAGNSRAGRLPTRKTLGGKDLHLGVEGGEGRETYNRVEGVQPDADNIDVWWRNIQGRRLYGHGKRLYENGGDLQEWAGQFSCKRQRRSSITFARAALLW